MKYRMSFLCAYCGEKVIVDTNDFADMLLLRSSYGCTECHLTNKLDHFLLLEGETEIDPLLYFPLIPYAGVEEGEFMFLMTPPRIAGYHTH